jgi:DNA-binding NtrC family response regulator
MTHTVLLVDDDAVVLHCLARILQNQPYQLYTARSGTEAVNVLEARRVDVIVSDERMPGMSGTDLFAWVAMYYPGVVRIMLTGRATMETAIRAINEGGVHYFFTKPCNEAHLAVVIRKALEHQNLLVKH